MLIIGFVTLKRDNVSRWSCSFTCFAIEIKETFGSESGLLLTF